jgi:competence protein ComGC
VWPEVTVQQHANGRHLCCFNWCVLLVMLLVLLLLLLPAHEMQMQGVLVNDAGCACVNDVNDARCACVNDVNDAGCACE